MRSGRIAGADARERAIRLAGALAESGVVEVELEGARLAARETDLPGRLCAALERGGCSIRGAGFEARFDAESCGWTATDGELGARLADISGA